MMMIVYFELSLKVNRLLSILYLEVIRLTTKHMCDIVVLRMKENKRNQSIIKNSINTFHDDALLSSTAGRRRGEKISNHLNKLEEKSSD